MRIAVVGAGALGGFYGGLLARAGENLTFVARGQTLATLRDAGLTVRSRLAGEFTLPVDATDDPDGIGPVDLVFLGVKTYDLNAAIATVRPLVGPETMVLCVQNGIDGPERVGNALGEGAVIAGAVYVSATVEAPGVVAQVGGPGLVHLGELTGGRTPRLKRLGELFVRAGVPTEVHADVRRPLWQKFMTICAMSGLTALTRLTLRQIFACPETRLLYRDLMAEVTAVARARGVDLPEDAADEMLRTVLAMDPPPERGSMAYDLLAGRRLEVEDLNGAVVRLGRELGVPTPINRVVHAALKPLAAGAPDPA